MYEKIKHILKAVIPSNILKRQKKNLRKMYGLLYRGNTHECNLCAVKLRAFIQLQSNDLICPNCGSIPRTRGLWNKIKSELNGQSVLHFSPSPSLKRIIELKGNTKTYITTDYEGEFDSQKNYNIENLDIENDTFDIIICYHILEHIPNDMLALRELKRVLKDNGTCYVQTPFKEGSIYENDSITDPAERLAHFGQADHVRIYSPEGLKERMERVGFQVTINNVINDVNNYWGLKTKDITLEGK